jgi:hypothetical protein
MYNQQYANFAKIYKPLENFRRQEVDMGEVQDLGIHKSLAPPYKI